MVEDQGYDAKYLDEKRRMEKVERGRRGFHRKYRTRIDVTARVVAKSVDETDQVWFTDMAMEGWGSHPDLYQILKN